MGSGQATLKHNNNFFVDEEINHDNSLKLFEIIENYEDYHNPLLEIELALAVGETTLNESDYSIFECIYHYQDLLHDSHHHILNLIVEKILDNIDNQTQNWQSLLLEIEKDSYLYQTISPDNIKRIKQQLPDDDIRQELMTVDCQLRAENLFEEAIKKNKFDYAKYLLQQKTTKSDYVKKQQQLFFRAILANDEVLVDELIANGVNVNALDNHQNNALIMASHCKNEAIFKKILAKTDDINKPNDSGDTALIIACCISNPQFVALLCGQDDIIMDLTNKRQLSALSYCYDKPEIMSMLLTHGANPHQTDPNQISNLYLTVLHQQYETTKLLLDAGVNPQEKCYDRTAMQIAVNFNYLDIVELLVKANADIHEVSKSGKSLLVRAAKSNSIAMVDYLLSQNASLYLTKDRTIFDELENRQEHSAMNIIITSIVNHKDEYVQNWQLLEEFLERNPQYIENLTSTNKILLTRQGITCEIYELASSEVDFHEKFNPNKSMQSFGNLYDFNDYNELDPATTVENPKISHRELYIVQHNSH